MKENGIAAYIWFFVSIAALMGLGISRVTIVKYKSQVEELTSELLGMTSVAVSCGAEMEEAIEWQNTCTATVYTMGNAQEECDRLVEKASEGLDTCMSNVEFFKEMAAYNESNLDTCLYDLRVERGQRTDGN